MTRRLRTDRMLRRVREERTVELLRASGEEVRERAAIGWLPSGFLEAGPVGDAQAARWQHAWDETVGDGRPQRLIWLPSRTVIRTGRPRKSTPRGLPRMREHTRSLLLNALRGDRPLPRLLTNQTETNGASHG